jgi:hypothetical protein
MRIEIVVNERNMSESTSKRGPKRRFGKQIQKEENRMLNWVRAEYGDQCDRWNELRSVLRVKTNAEVAKILLDW